MKEGGREGVRAEIQRDETGKSSRILRECFNALMLITLTSGGTSLAQGKEIRGLVGNRTSYSIIALARGYK